MNAEQLYFQFTTERTYDEFPKPPGHKDVPSVDPDMPEYGWSQEDWYLYMNGEHPNIEEAHP